MGITNRPNSYTNGTTADATEVNSDFDTLYNAFNGNIDNANVKAAAAIDPDKLDDHSNTDAEALIVSNPGTSDSLIKATDLPGELTRLRHNDLAPGLGESCKYFNGTSIVGVGPWDGARVGPNMVYNGSVQVQSGGAGTAPDGWNALNSPGTLAHVSAVSAEGATKPLKIVSNVGSGAIRQNVLGIKSDTLYVVGCRARAVVNTGLFTVAGTGVLANPNVFAGTGRAIAVHATDYSTYAFAVKTLPTVTPTSNIQITAEAGGVALDELYVLDFFCFEVSKDARSFGGVAMREARDSTPFTQVTPSGSGNAWVSANSGAYDLSETPFRNNQRLTYSAVLHIDIGPTALISTEVSLKRDGVIVDGPLTITNSSGVLRPIFNLVDVYENPPPGTAVDYTVEVYQDNVTSYDIEWNNTTVHGFNPVSVARLQLEDI